MKCPKCGTEHSGRFCPKCGTPADLQQAETGRRRRPGKSILKRWWFWALVAAVILIFILSLGGGDDEIPASSPGLQSVTPGTAGTTTPQATQPEPTEDLSAVETVYTLTDGYFVSGIDIPAGKCNITAADGQGNLSSSNLYSGGVNEMFGIDDGSGLYTESFNGLKLPEGTTLSVSGGLTIRIEYTSIDSGFSGRTYDEDNAITLGTGNYTAGTDFDAGVYKITAISGSGNLSSSNLFSGGVNEMFGVDDGSGWYVSEIMNVDLPDGAELSVSGGVTVKLIPAAEK